MADVSRSFLGDVIPGFSPGYSQAISPLSPVNPSSVSATVRADSAAAAVAGVPGATASFSMVWWLVMFGGVIALMLLARLLGKGEGFADLKLSAYNVLVVGWIAVLGIIFYKALFTTFKVPYVSAAVAGV